jgi:FkbM family methyltransferase
VTVDVGANCGLYTRELARLSKEVHAFEPSRQMADLLRRTSAANVHVHEIACSDQSGDAQLFIPDGENGPVFGLASLEPRAEFLRDHEVSSAEVHMTRLDAIIDRNVSFIKVDVEGHELSALIGAEGLIQRSQPIFLVEAEDRHREYATQSVFDFFRSRHYRGFFLDHDAVVPVELFDAGTLQDPSALLPNGGRKSGRSYVNNFFFFPQQIHGESLLAN